MSRDDIEGRDEYQVRGLLARGASVIRSVFPSPADPKTSLHSVTCAIEPLRLQWRDRVGFAPTSLTHLTEAFQRRV